MSQLWVCRGREISLPKERPGRIRELELLDYIYKIKSIFNMVLNFTWG